MKIAFYAPMKPADAATPSGDRQMARAIIAALEGAGHKVRIASRFRSWCGGGDAAMQTLAGQADTEADRVLQGWNDEGWRPDLMLTYHVYHKAPDWIGPKLTRAMGLPYVIIEGARALKQEHGPWSLGFAAADRAFAAADAVVAIHAEDAEGLAPVVPEARLWRLPPFIDTAPFRAVAAGRTMSDTPRLLAVGMMRAGDKHSSYAVLATALDCLAGRAWRLTVAGDGPAAASIRPLFAPDRTDFLGEVAPAEMPSVYAQADIFVWPAVNEAYGLVLLEAQAAGLPVVAGHTGGVPDIVADGETGLLSPEGDAPAFAVALDRLLADPALVSRMGAAAAKKATGEHDIATARLKLQTILDAALERYRARGAGGAP